MKFVVIMLIGTEAVLKSEVHKSMRRYPLFDISIGVVIFLLGSSGKPMVVGLLTPKGKTSWMNRNNSHQPHWVEETVSLCFPVDQIF